MLDDVTHRNLSDRKTIRPSTRALTVVCHWGTTSPNDFITAGYARGLIDRTETGIPITRAFTSPVVVRSSGFNERVASTAEPQRITTPRNTNIFFKYELVIKAFICLFFSWLPVFQPCPLFVTQTPPRQPAPDQPGCSVFPPLLRSGESERISSSSLADNRL